MADSPRLGEPTNTILRIVQPIAARVATTIAAAARSGVEIIMPALPGDSP